MKKNAPKLEQILQQHQDTVVSALAELKEKQHIFTLKLACGPGGTIRGAQIGYSSESIIRLEKQG